MIINKRLKTLMILLMVLSISFLFSATRDALTTGTSDDTSSFSNTKGLGDLEIVAQLEYGTDTTNFIFNRNGSTYNMQPFNYVSTTTDYNYATSAATNFLTITFPTTGDYKLTAIHYGGENGNTATTAYSDSLVNGIISVPLKYAETSAGMDANGNPNADTQNNVLTIVSDPGTGTEATYILRFRRRVENVPTSIDNINQVGNTFTCNINVANSTINGDAISSYKYVDWSVNSLTGTGYFTNNTLTPLSNGNITVTATLRNKRDVTATSGNIELSGLSSWSPHLGKLELSYPARDVLEISPNFNSNPSATGTYVTSIISAFSNIRLNLMAPSDCQVYIDDARVSSNGESVLRIGPTHPTDSAVGPTHISFNIKVVNGQGTKNYVLNIQREISDRLKYGRDATPHPHLKPTTSANDATTGCDGDVFGMNDAETDKFTVQAWARWTSDPSTSPAWGNIVSQTTSANGSSGSFWLQHNNRNSSFEFAIKPTGSRVYVLSDPAKVTIQQGIWYMVTGVYDGNRNPVKIYVNDQDVTLNTRNTNGNIYVAPNSKFNIGKMAHGDRPFNGNIRNVRMWVGEALSLAEIAADYASNPEAGTTADDSDFSWPLNETSVTTVVTGNGGKTMTMSSVTAVDFVSCCENNRTPGKALVHRPERMDLSSETSESVILVQAKDYSGSAFRFDIVGVQDDDNKVDMDVWDHASKTWISPSAISSGVLIDSELGNPTTGTFFWVPVRRGTSVAGSGRYVDDNYETGYDGSDGTPAGRIKYNSKILLPEVEPLGATFQITGTVSGTPEHSIVAGKRYVILGYDAVEKGRLITGTSSYVSSKGGKAVVSYTLLTDKPLYRVEVRTQDDTLLTNINSEAGWNEETDLGDITLPVELSSFTVAAITNGAKLQWVSHSESGLMGYYVYRAETEDLASAELVSPVIEASNLTQTHVYTYTDLDILTQTEYYYWLMASEYSGEFSMYGPINIILSEEGHGVEIPVITGLDKLYPNPFNPKLNIRYSLKETADINLNIYNLKGQKVHSKELLSQEVGYHQYTWDASENSSGIYFVVFKSGKTKEVRKVILNK